MKKPKRKKCPECSARFKVASTGRPKTYCSDKCRKRGQRRRWAKTGWTSLASTAV